MLRKKLGHGVEVTVKIDYQDLGQVLVRVPDHLIGHNDLGDDAWIVVPGPQELAGISLRHLELADDEMAMRFGYDKATSEKHRREARQVIRSAARDAARLRLTDVEVSPEYVEKRQKRSFHPTLQFGDAAFISKQLETLLAPVALAKAKAQPADDFDLSDDTTPISYTFRD